MGFISDLFEVKEEILRCVILSEDEAVDTETGEMIDVEALEQLKMDFDDKVENIAKWLKNKQAYADALKAEKMKLAKRQAAAERDVVFLEGVLDRLLNGQKFERPLVKISYRASKQVVVDDLKEVPEEFLKYKEPEVDKMAVKKVFKEGVSVPGTHIEEVNNISVK